MTFARWFETIVAALPRPQAAERKRRVPREQHGDKSRNEQRRGHHGLAVEIHDRLTAKLETRAELVVFARTNGVVGPDAG
jgi:hypothetical protein